MPVRKFPVRPAARVFPTEDARAFPLPPPHGVLVSITGSGGVACGGHAHVIFKVPIEVPVHIPQVTGGPPISKRVRVAVPLEKFVGSGALEVGGAAKVTPFIRPVRRRIVGNGGVAAGAAAAVILKDLYGKIRTADEEELLLFWVA